MRPVNSPALFVSCNRGKRSLSIDIKSEAGARGCWPSLRRRRTCWCRTSVPAPWNASGLGHEELRKKYPRLIYVAISGVGDSGQYVKKRVYDPIVQALSGFADIQSQRSPTGADDPHHRLRQDDLGVHGAGGVLGALRAREDRAGRLHPGGDARHHDLVSVAPEGMMQYTVVGKEATAGDPNDRPDLVFQTLDGYITAGTISDSEWQGFCRATGDPELAKDERFATPTLAVHQCDGTHPHDAGLHPQAHHGGVAGAARQERRAVFRRSCAGARSSPTSRWWRAA